MRCGAEVEILPCPAPPCLAATATWRGMWSTLACVACGVWHTVWCSATNDKRQISLQLQQCWWQMMMMMKWKGGGRRELRERPNAMMNSYVPQKQKQRGQEAGGRRHHRLRLLSRVARTHKSPRAKGKGKYWHSLSECSQLSRKPRITPWQEEEEEEEDEGRNRKITGRSWSRQSCTIIEINTWELK